MRVPRVEGSGNPPRPSSGWRWSSLFWTLLRRDVKMEYAGSRLGFVWFLLDPLLTILVFYFAFTYVFGFRPIQNYGLFLTIGVLHWHLFAVSVRAGSRMVQTNRGLLTSAVFPRGLLPASLVLAEGVSLAAAMGLLAVIIVPFGGHYWFGLLLYPAVLACFLVMLTGVTMTSSVLGALIEDSRAVLGLLLRIGFWVTPVAYRYQNLPPDLRRWLVFNPLAPFMNAARDLWLFTRLPAATTWFAMIAWAIVVAGIGWLIFQRYERILPEVAE